MTIPSDNSWHYFGKHAVRFEPPDVVFSRPDGDMSMDEFKQIMQFVAALPKPEKGIIALVDAAKAGRQDPAVIKDSGLKEYTRGHRATVYFNARFHHRTLIGIFQRVGRLLNLTSTSVPMMFFDSEAEARAWIDEQRTGAEPSP